MPEVETSNSLKILVKTSFFVFFMILASKIFSYLYKLIIARNFGPEIYGTFSLAIIVLGLFAGFAMIGIPEGITRFVSFYRGRKEEAKNKKIIKFVSFVLSFSSIIAGICLFLTSEAISIGIFNNPNLTYYLKVFSISLPFSVIFSVMVSYLRGIGKINVYSLLVNVFQNGLKVGLLSLLIVFGLGEKSVAISYTATVAILALIAYIFTRKDIILLFKEKNIENKNGKKIEKEILSYSVPLLFAGLLYGLFYWTDSLVLGYLTDSGIVGLYNAAVTLVSLFAIAQDLFIQLFFPMLSEKYAQGKKSAVRDISKQVMKWVYIINMVIFSAMVVFPGLLIGLFFGSEYSSSETPLRILAFGAMLSGFLGLFMALMSIKGKTKTILIDYFVFTVINLVLDIFLVKQYGMNGAAIATSIVWVLFSITVALQIKLSYGFFPIKREMIKITIIALVLTFLAYLAKDLIYSSLVNMIVFGVLFVLIYIGLLFITGCFDEQDKEIINAVKKKLTFFKNDYFTASTV